MEHSIKLPPNFDLRAANAATEWRLWRLCFEDYLVGSGQDNAADKIKLALLRNMLGMEAARIVITSLQLSESEKDNYDSVMNAITKYVSPRVNEVFERFKFNNRKQLEGESFDNFFTECKQLILTCNYKQNKDSIEDQLLRDKIVQGVSDKTVQESLLKLDNLTLEKAANYCRTSEMSKQQVQEMNPTIEIDVVKKSKERNQVQKKYLFQCRRCQTQHGLRECPAFGKKCTRCGKLNHLAVSCKVKKINSTQEDSEESDGDDTLFCGALTSKGKNKWMDFININGKSTYCKIDTGAEVSIMPTKIFKELKSSEALRPTSTLEAFDGTKVKAIGKIRLHCKYRERECYEDFRVLDCKSMILGLPGCEALKLVKRIYSVDEAEDGTLKEDFIKENIDVFQGHGPN
ncbi:uncharacterized protein LOC134677054 [Cydia fagiglandana]|uniref:uncharacterized protein LOC134677054 n=2 Tax=Cydia fagiglandana TaxID=1458189 RepID=UPI002FEE2FDF